jgi:DNA polymerase-3 subunit alpha
MGLLKMDFLGLTTLTVIDDCLKLIRQNQGVVVDMEMVPLDDQRTYEEIFHRALTSGIFQFESGGMRDVLRRYKPTSVEDLTALNALYRPGPIQGGMIDDFIDRKWGRKQVAYELPELERLLKETLGVIVYQEQVMQIANVLAGYSLGEADLLRRAMGKKDPAEMGKQRERFVSGATSGNDGKKYPKDKIVYIFDQMEKFAGYGFNKSHSAAYALLAYHTAYLKTHYPVEFMASLLTSEISKPENVVKYIKECRELGIEVQPPDIQLSGADFTPLEKSIRFGLTAIKNVGRNAIDSILNARKLLQEEKQRGFLSLREFCEKVDLRLLNKRVLESLIKSGAFDSMGRRSALIAGVDKAMESAQKSQRDEANGQHGLFAMLGSIFDDAHANGNGHRHDDLPNVPDWDEHQRLQSEKEVLGFFVSGHPLDKYADKIKNVGAVDTATALEMKPATPTRRGQQQPENDVSIAGVIVDLKVAKSKRSGEMYAQASLEDTVGKIDLICFPKDYTKLGEALKIDVPVLVRGQLRAEEDAAPKLAVSSIQALEDVRVKLPQSVRIKVTLDRSNDQTLISLRGMIEAAPGPGKLMINLEQKGEYAVMLEPEGLSVAADRVFIERAEQLLGRGAVQALD